MKLESQRLNLFLFSQIKFYPLPGFEFGSLDPEADDLPMCLLPSYFFPDPTNKPKALYLNLSINYFADVNDNFSIQLLHLRLKSTGHSLNSELRHEHM